ncbi:MAG: phenylalanine--tRNA ligase subunit alpha [Chloroflexi bacterium]|nr:phenylalanine--tRNA ligase subunit alpha [Chloroflexota bacterium]
MEDQLNKLKEDTEQKIREIDDLDLLQELKVAVVGRKGELTLILRGLSSVPDEDRPRLGKMSNDIKQHLISLIDEKEARLKQETLSSRLMEERVDVTMPGQIPETGRIHPLRRTLRRMKEIFEGMGFSVKEGPEVETEYYNFEALNIPAQHASRDMWDSFYLGRDLLLRSHTSPVQVRVMEKEEPPLRVISIGKCFRRDAVDASHFWIFNQVEGFMVDEGVTFGDLKGVLLNFAREMFGKERRIKFIPSYFPFTEPSAEICVDCFVCKGKGCRSCGGSGWLEILGAGMINPAVYKWADGLREKPVYDPEKYTGFAFGIGVERIAMLANGIDDIRLFYENDSRFLKQF